MIQLNWEIGLYPTYLPKVLPIPGSWRIFRFLSDSHG
jgi:hypothetical protein